MLEFWTVCFVLLAKETLWVRKATKVCERITPGVRWQEQHDCDH